MCQPVKVPRKVSPSKWVMLKTFYTVASNSELEARHSRPDTKKTKLCKKLASLLNSRKHKQVYRQVMSAEWNNQIGSYWPDFGRAKASVAFIRNNLLRIEFAMPLCVLLPLRAKPMMPLNEMFTQVRDELVRRDYAAGHLARIGFTEFEIMPEPTLWKMTFK